MKKAILLVVACSFVAAAGFGQSPVQFRSTEWVGLSAGQVGSAGQIQTVNGAFQGPWFVGVGAGLDYYRFRSVPLFLSVTRDIALGKRDWLFLYLDGGTNLPWYKRPETTENNYVSDAFHGGEYWSGGLGYLWKLGDHTSKAVLLSAGYTVKKLNEDETVNGGCYGMSCNVAERFEYLNRMYLFMIGFRF